MTRQSEVDRLMEQSQEQQRENQIVKRKARVNQEMASRLQEDLQREKQRSERLEGALKEAMNKMDDSQVSRICNAATVESLRSEIKQMSKKHNETLSGLNNVQNKLLSTINQQHASQVHSLEKTVANLQRANSTLENERSRCLREKQSSDQMYQSFERHCNNKENFSRCNVQSKR
jgi:CRISPR/Cas system CSM-associated protein Csm2 small subunit